jgi:predicted ATPase
VRPHERQLLVDGVLTAVGARAFDLLLALIERRDRLVAKAELLDLVWPGLVVEENNLQVQISSLRKLLGPQTIATIPGRGYRFTAPLDGAADTGAVALPPVSAPLVHDVRAPAARRSNLPGELPVLYGRDDDLQALCSLMAEHRLVTVVGAGGIGKSRLAQAAAFNAAGQWPDGAWMVELAGLSEPALVPGTVAGVLDIKVQEHGAARDELVAGLATRSMLLVLDNCEHLLDAVVELVEALLRDAPGVTMLATSQEPLRITDEQQFRLMPLAVPAQAQASHASEFGAVALFEARVRAVDSRFALNDENAKLAIDICRRLDGLPLAIELAAARVSTLGLRTVRDRLDARFKLLTGGARATLRRHQTLRAALEWSHGLLNEPERIVFRRLGVFAGGFTMELAQAVAGDADLDDWAVLESLSALVDKSLVVAEPGEPPRYRLLESARAFALEQLAEGETADILRRHALGMLQFLRRVDGTNLDGEYRTDQYAALVVPELDNLRAAYTWASSEEGEPKVAIALAAHAGSLIDYAAECADWLLPHRSAVEQGAVDAAVTARYWRALAAGNMSGRLPLALCVEAAKRARRGYQALGQPRREFSSLIRLIGYLLSQGDDGAAREAFDEARQLIRPEWPNEFHIFQLRREASLARSAGRIDEALALIRKEVDLGARIGDWRLEVIARNNLVDLLWQVGPIEEAAHEAQRLAHDLRLRPSTASDTDVLYANLIGILCEMDRIEEASDAGREALPVMRRSRNFFLEEWVYLFWRRGQPDVAAQLLGSVERLSGATGLPPQPNEQRLITRARAALAQELPSDVFAAHLAVGAALSPEKVHPFLAESLARPAVLPANPRST